jgi:hypothetical protein
MGSPRGRMDVVDKTATVADIDCSARQGDDPGSLRWCGFRTDAPSAKNQSRESLTSMTGEAVLRRETALLFEGTEQFRKAGDSVSFRNVLLFGQAACFGFGDSVEVPSEVIVQCLFSFERVHCNHLKSSG